MASASRLICAISGVASLTLGSIAGTPPIDVLLSVGRTAGSPPEEILGQCTATCVDNPAYPCMYTPTYPVWFSPNGTFSWRAPYSNGTAVEIGHGGLFTEASIVRDKDGSWAAHWYGGNRYVPDPKQVTHCACYYAEGVGQGDRWLLSNYEVAYVPNSFHLSLEETCRPHALKCPLTNSSAFARWGPPWVEKYIGCESPSNTPSTAPVDVLLSVGNTAGSPPEEILGQCTATCVDNPTYPCMYTPTYPVWFSPNGTFSWRAPYLNGTAVEIGHGGLFTAANIIRHQGGSWAAHWYGGNRYVPDPKQVTHCACYYAEGVGRGQRWLLSNYEVAYVPNSFHLSVEETCKPHFLKCPSTNASAFERWGPPWVEKYIGCESEPIVIFM